MKYEVRISGQTRIVEIERNAEGWQATLDGKAAAIADVAETAPNTFSVLLAGQSREISVTSSADGKLNLQSGRFEFTAEVIDPRSWRGRRHGSVEAEGRQQVVAPIPGKVIRVLVGTGEKVEAGQGLLVVEAMKMQNEIRSPKSGTVERVQVKEGQAVNAGEVLAWVN
jgi:biotin carboxyl carrier protein